VGITRRVLLGGIAAGAAFGPAFAAPSADGWPARPVRMLSPYGAGGSNDISLRILAEQFELRMGQKFLVENKPGAGSTIANQMVAHAEADGYTLLYAAAPYATAEAMLGKLNYDPRKDLRPVALAVLVPLFLIVNAKSPWKTVQEFVADAKSKPDGMTFASPAVGSQPHLAAELFMRTAGFKGLAFSSRATPRPTPSCSPDGSMRQPRRFPPRCPISRPETCACSAASPRSAVRPIRIRQRCVSRGRTLFRRPGSASSRLLRRLMRLSTRCRRRWGAPFRTAM
jgi:hypothetical protein